MACVFKPEKGLESLFRFLKPKLLFLAVSGFLFSKRNSPDIEFSHMKWKPELAKQQVPTQKMETVTRQTGVPAQKI